MLLVQRPIYMPIIKPKKFRIASTHFKFHKRPGNIWKTHYLVRNEQIPKKQQQEATAPNFRVEYGSSTDWSRLVTFVLFHHSILSKVILFVTSFISMSFYTTSTNYMFGLSLPFFVPLNMNQLTLSYQCIKHSSLDMIKPSGNSSSSFYQLRKFPVLNFWWVQ